MAEATVDNRSPTSERRSRSGGTAGGWAGFLHPGQISAFVAMSTIGRGLTAAPAGADVE